MKFFIIAIFIVSCSHQVAKQIIEEIKDHEIKGVTFEPVEKYSTVKEREIIAKASKKIDEVIKSDCFKAFILNSKLSETNNRSNLEVYNHLIGLNGVVPVKIYYKRFTSAVAYREPPSDVINLNRYFFTEKTGVCKWGATMAHESLGHSLGGYSHGFKWSVEREYTVPYKLGGGQDKYGSNAFTQCCRE